MTFDLENIGTEHAARREALVRQWRRQGMSEEQIRRNIGERPAGPPRPKEPEPLTVDRVFEAVAEAADMPVDYVWDAWGPAGTTARRVARWLAVHCAGATWEELGCHGQQGLTKSLDHTMQRLQYPTDNHRIWHDAALAKLGEQ